MKSFFHVLIGNCFVWKRRTLCDKQRYTHKDTHTNRHILQTLHRQLSLELKWYWSILWWFVDSGMNHVMSPFYLRLLYLLHWRTYKLPNSVKENIYKTIFCTLNGYYNFVYFFFLIQDNFSSSIFFRSSGTASFTSLSKTFRPVSKKILTLTKKMCCINQRLSFGLCRVDDVISGWSLKPT